MKDLDDHIHERALAAEAACTRIINALEAKSWIVGVTRYEGDPKAYLMVNPGGDLELISVQAILDLADLLRREPLR